MSLICYLDFFRSQPTLAFCNNQQPNVATHYTYYGRTVFAHLDYGNTQFRVRCEGNPFGGVRVFVGNEEGELDEVDGVEGIQKWLTDAEPAFIG